MPGSEYKTNSRTKIKEYLEANRDRTVSVKDIASHMEDEKLSVNLTTIYRYLDKLEKEGAVLKYTGEKGDKATYQYVGSNNGCDEHLHLKCTNCGAVIHLNCKFMDQISEHISSHHGFSIQCKNSVIYGLCSECAKKSKENKE